MIPATTDQAPIRRTTDLNLAIYWRIHGLVLVNVTCDPPGPAMMAFADPDRRARKLRHTVYSHTLRPEFWTGAAVRTARADLLAAIAKARR